MLKDQNFDAERLIAKLKPRAFGIDLHWLPHAHGSLEVAALCKKYHLKFRSSLEDILLLIFMKS